MRAASPVAVGGINVLEAASAVGRLRVEGEQASVAAFGQWFKGA
jgi:hypothetical protein